MLTIDRHLSWGLTSKCGKHLCCAILYDEPLPLLAVLAFNFIDANAPESSLRIEGLWDCSTMSVTVRSLTVSNLGTRIRILPGP